MNNKHGDGALEDNGAGLSLIYTLHVVSHLSRDEFELLKLLRNDRSMLENYKGEETEKVSTIKKILKSFNLSSIQEVIDIVENYKLFELYNF